MKYKQQLRSSAGRTADSRSSGGSGATRQDSLRQGPLPSSRRSPSPTSDQQKMSRGHSDPDDHNIQHGGQTKLFVKNIPPDVREHDLEAAFGRYGRVQRVYRHPSNYGFVVFSEPQAADAARCHLNGKYFFGNHIIVQFAKDPKIPQYDNHNDHVDQCNRYGQRGDNSKLFVSNISKDIKDYHVEGLFSQFGRVREVCLKGNIGFVEFYDPQDADVARSELDGEEFGWSHISVEFATGVQSIPSDCNQFGKKGHSIQNSQKSRNDLGIEKSYSRSPSPHSRGRNWSYRRSGSKRRGRRYLRSPSPHHGKGRGKSYSRSRSPRHGKGRIWTYSRSPPLRRDNTDGQGLLPRSPLSQPQPQEQEEPSTKGTS